MIIRKTALPVWLHGPYFTGAEMREPVTSEKRYGLSGSYF